MGGSGGGGGSSGKVDYPDYMKERHSVLYDDIRRRADAAIAANPYVGMYGWDPTCMVQNMEATVDYYDYIINNFEPMELWKQLMGEVPAVVFGMLDMQPLDDYIDQQKTRLRQGVEDEVLPKFRRGMQNVGAVMTSAFKIGEALLWAREMQEEAATEKEMRGKLALAAYEYSFRSANDVIQLTLQKISYHKDVVHYNMESLRMAYVAGKEYTDANNVYSVERAKWSLEMSKYMMDALGSIASSAGTSYTTSSGGSSKAASALGGAMSGAAIGASVAGPWGAAIGGAAGLVAGLF